MHQVRNRIGAGILILAAGAALAACTSSTSGGGGTTPTPSGGAGGSATPGGTGGGQPAQQAASATPAAAGFPSDAQSYAQATLTAWEGGDQARLGDLTSTSVTVFETISSSAYDHNYHLYQCQGAAGSSYCMAFNTVGDQLTLRLSNQLLGQPHAVVGGDFKPITFPADMQAYAQEAMDAWIAHNTACDGLLLTPAAVTALNAIDPARQADGWTFSDSQGAAGSSYLAWKNPAGDKIAFRFNNPGVVPNESPQHRIFEVLWMPHQ